MSSSSPVASGYPARKWSELNGTVKACTGWASIRAVGMTVGTCMLQEEAAESCKGKGPGVW